LFDFENDYQENEIKVLFFLVKRNESNPNIEYQQHTQQHVINSKP